MSSSIVPISTSPGAGATTDLATKFSNALNAWQALQDAQQAYKAGKEHEIEQAVSNLVTLAQAPASAPGPVPVPAPGPAPVPAPGQLSDAVLNWLLGFQAAQKKRKDTLKAFEEGIKQLSEQVHDYMETAPETAKLVLENKLNELEKTQISTETSERTLDQKIKTLNELLLEALKRQKKGKRVRKGRAKPAPPAGP